MYGSYIHPLHVRTYIIYMDISPNMVNNVMHRTELHACFNFPLNFSIVTTLKTYCSIIGHIIIYICMCIHVYIHVHVATSCLRKPLLYSTSPYLVDFQQGTHVDIHAHKVARYRGKSNPSIKFNICS